MPRYEDSAAESPQRRMIRAYGDIGRSPRHDSQTRRLSLLNSNWRCDTCSSRQRCMPRRLSCAPGVSTTEIGAMSRNGYSRSGVSP